MLPSEHRSAEACPSAVWHDVCLLVTSNLQFPSKMDCVCKKDAQRRALNCWRNEGEVSSEHKALLLLPHAGQALTLGFVYVFM